MTPATPSLLTEGYMDVGVWGVVNFRRKVVFMSLFDRLGMLARDGFLDVGYIIIGR